MADETILIVVADENAGRIFHEILAHSSKIVSAYSAIEALCYVDQGVRSHLILCDLWDPR